MVEKIENDNLLKVVVCGDRGVGKTTFIDSLRKFSIDEENKMETNNDFAEIKFICDQKNWRMHIYEHQSTPTNSEITTVAIPKIYEGSHIIISCFDLCHKQSLENAC